MNTNFAALPRRALATRQLASAILMAMASAGSPFFSAHALEFGDQNGWHSTLNTTVSYGVSQRVADRNESLIGKAYFNPLVSQLPNAQQRTASGRFSVNTDDGDLNYDQGDLFSNVFKITSEFNLKYQENWGAFVRASYFYDFTNNRKDFLSELAKEKIGTDFKFLDAFVFHNFEVGDHQGSIRLGRQVVSWGESTFIQNGINVINPVDVSKLRSAGSELKEAFLPVNMLWGSYNFTDNLSAELLYQFEFSQTEPDPAGTYFSTNDFATLGGQYVMLNFGLVPQPVINPENYYPVCFGNRATDTTLPAALVPTACNVAIPRSPDRYPSESGQWGGAVRYFAENLNNTEFGFYYLNYHSRLPVISATSITSTNLRSGRYYVEYPENIHLFGVSFNTQLENMGVALQGELSHRPNVPLQVDDVELLFAALSPLNALIPQPGNRFISQLGSVPVGTDVQGWYRHEVSQAQLTATKAFGPGNWLGAEQIALVAEVGATEVWDLPEQDELRYQGDGTDTGGEYDVLTGRLRNPQTQIKGFPTSFSWGYRLALRADYPNAFGSSINLSPRFAFNHDVNGISPGPGGNFIEDRKSVTLGVEANYLNRWSADVSYTNFFGAGDLNLIHDRDFVTFAVKYSF